MRELRGLHARLRSHRATSSSRLPSPDATSSSAGARPTRVTTATPKPRSARGSSCLSRRSKFALRANLSQTRHDFPAALADLDAVLTRNPENAQAWLTRAVILQVQGDYPKALGNCLSLERLAGTLVTAICT